MSQVSLYLEGSRMVQLRERAASCGQSLSKYVAEVLDDAMSNRASGWPDGYWDKVYGCMSDAALDQGSGSCLDPSLDDDCNWFEGE